MKSYREVIHRVFAVLAGFLLIVTTGCQESSTPSRVADIDPSPAMKLKPQVKVEAFPLEGILAVPGRGSNSYATINGSAVCTFTTTMENGLYLVSLDLSTEAVFTFDGTDKTTFKVSGKSHDNISVSDEGIALLDKSYRIEGAPNPLNIRLRFVLTSHGIGMNGMWLEQSRVTLAEANAY